MAIELIKDWQARNRGGITPNSIAWHHGLDYLSTILRADVCETPYFGTAWHSEERVRHLLGEDGQNLLGTVRDAIESYSDADMTDFIQIAEETLSKPRKRGRDVIGQDGDDIDIDAFVERTEEDDPIWLGEVRDTERRKAGLNIIMSGEVPGAQTGQTYMRERQRHAYRLCLQCEQERRPARVIAVFHSKFEAMGDTCLTQYIVLKDWHDPVFPALWGMFQNNLIANAASCLNSICILGSTERSLGKVQDKSIGNDLPEGEEIHIQAPHNYISR